MSTHTQIQVYKGRRFSKPKDLAILKENPDDIGSLCIKSMSGEQIKMAEISIIYQIDKYIGLSEKYSNEEILKFAEVIIEHDPTFKLDEILYILKAGANAEFGKQFGKFSLNIFGDWATQYRGQIADIRRQNHEQAKTQKLIPDEVMIDERFNFEPMRKMIDQTKKKLTKYNSIEDWIEHNKEETGISSIDLLIEKMNYKSSYQYFVRERALEIIEKHNINKMSKDYYVNKRKEAEKKIQEDFSYQDYLKISLKHYLTKINNG